MSGIQRGASILATVGVLGLVGYLTSEQLSKPIAHVNEAEAGAEDAGAASDASAAAVDAAPAAAAESDSGALTLDLDAGALPTSLANSAPRSVKLGVVLVQYDGAEGATSHRSKADALKRARELADQAKTDFSGAVKAGDPGSSSDIGRIPRGVLEQPTEIAVFNLAAGDLSEPLETPRGYWVVKRLE